MLKLSLIILIVLSLGISVLGSNRFADAGYPPIDRPWIAADYLTASKIINGSGADLLRMADLDAAPYLKHLLSPANLARFRDQSVPLLTRHEESLVMISAFSHFYKRYERIGTQLVEGISFHREIAAIRVFMLRLQVECLKLMAEVLPSLPRDSRLTIRMENMRKITEGAAVYFRVCVDSLVATHYFTEEDYTLMFQAMQECLPTLKRVFPPSTLAELKGSLEQVRLLFKTNAQLTAIDAMVAELSK